MLVEPPVYPVAHGYLGWLDTHNTFERLPLSWRALDEPV